MVDDMFRSWKIQTSWVESENEKYNFEVHVFGKVCDICMKTSTYWIEEADLCKHLNG